MNKKIAFLLIAVISVSSVAGTAAFTSGQVDRQATVQVVGDDAALTGLAPGATDLVYYDGSNELQIDFGNVDTASGVNANSTYTLGDETAANETYAFNVTNNYNTEYTYKFDYEFDNNTSNNGNVSLMLYNDQGDLRDTASTGSGPGSITLTSGDVGYVVIELKAAETDLSGTLSVTIN